MTPAAEVWIRPCDSVTGMRWTRCTPPSYFRLAQTPSSGAVTVRSAPAGASLTALTVTVTSCVVMLPAALAASCGFMLPVATPPNAVVYGTGKIPIRFMVRTGFWLNIAGITTVSVVLWLRSL